MLYVIRVYVYFFLYSSESAFHAYMYTLQFLSKKKNKFQKNAFFLAIKLLHCSKADRSEFGPLISKIRLKKLRPLHKRAKWQDPLVLTLNLSRKNFWKKSEIRHDK